eukprot:m.45483 g.45483  ORF g.45483 m.45483 type:complete len:438 (+) comp10249_c0_seq2:301-1614(+)
MRVLLRRFLIACLFILAYEALRYHVILLTGHVLESKLASSQAVEVSGRLKPRKTGKFEIPMERTKITATKVTSTATSITKTKSVTSKKKVDFTKSVPRPTSVPLAVEKSKNWNVFLSDKAPYTPFAPHLDVIWSRGWYNAHLPPEGIPISYYNEPGRVTSPSASANHMFNGKCGYVWVRTLDVNTWARTALPNLKCDVTLISSDADDDIDQGRASSILSNPHVKGWYAQNVVMRHPKLFPIPIGLGLHNGFPGSPHTVDTIQRMNQIRKEAPEFLLRKKTILFDKGTLGSPGSRRYQHRDALHNAISKCESNGLFERMPRGDPVSTWGHYSSHQFALAPTGMGWDTHRLWELLFFGTVPILKRTPMELLLEPAHLPVVIVDDWDELCKWTNKDIKAMETKYKGWIKNVHEWLRPSLWVPWDKQKMERLCDISPGCRL